MKLTLRINERFGLTNFLNEIYRAKGLDLAGLNTAQKIIEKILVEQEEREEIEMREETNVDTGQTNLVWNPEKDTGKEIEFNSNEVKMIKEIIEKRNEDKAFGIQDRFVVSLAEKVGISLEAED